MYYFYFYSFAETDDFLNPAQRMTLEVKQLLFSYHFLCQTIIIDIATLPIVDPLPCVDLCSSTVCVTWSTIRVWVWFIKCIVAGSGFTS